MDLIFLYIASDFYNSKYNGNPEKDKQKVEQISLCSAVASNPLAQHFWICHKKAAGIKRRGDKKRKVHHGTGVLLVGILKNVHLRKTDSLCMQNKSQASMQNLINDCAAMKK